MKPPNPRTHKGSGVTTQRVALSLAVAGQGIVNLVSALLSQPPQRLLALRRIVPTEVLDTSRTFTFLAGALLLTTAWGLRRGKRRAFVAALFLCAVSVPVNMLKAFDFEEATAATLLMFALGVSGDAFRVKSREPSLGALRSRAIWAALGLVLYAVAGCWFLEARYGGGGSFVRAVSESAYRLLGVGHRSLLFPYTLEPHARNVIRWFLDSLSILAFTFVVGIGVAALKPVRHRGRHRLESARVAALLERHGDSSVAAFALSPGIDYFFSANGRAVIAYKFESDTLLAIGDPIGPEEEMLPLLAAFSEHCAERDWNFAFFQARPERLPTYRALGWRALHIGEDPILWTDRFTLEGSAMGDVRRSSRRIEAAGFEDRHFVPGVTPLDAAGEAGGLTDQLRQISSEWLAARRGEEKGFTMGRFDPHRLSREWVAVAWDRARGRAEAFVTWVPIWARRGWALDLMRRRRDAPAGVVDFLIVKSVEAAKSRGDALLSLSLSALAKVDGLEGKTRPDPSSPDGAPERARAFLMQHLARFYEFEGLFRWKEKFNPAFEDRYLVYPEPLALPQIALALARAQSPGGIRSYLRRNPARGEGVGRAGGRAPDHPGTEEPVPS
jgi:phosphatidylglycerol lysyltransferase